MGQAIAVRQDFTPAELRRLAIRTKDVAQARRLLAIAAILDGAPRAEAATSLATALISVIKDRRSLFDEHVEWLRQLPSRRRFWTWNGGVSVRIRYAMDLHVGSEIRQRSSSLAIRRAWPITRQGIGLRNQTASSDARCKPSSRNRRRGSSGAHACIVSNARSLPRAIRASGTHRQIVCCRDMVSLVLRMLLSGEPFRFVIGQERTQQLIGNNPT